jgi:small conductance mechanosensitive channel
VVALDFSPAFEQLQHTFDGFVRALPSILVGLLVLFAFYLASSIAARSVRHLSNRYRRQRNLGLVMGRLIQWLVLLIGVLVTAVIIFPNFTPARMIEFLGIGSVAIGFAFRDILQNFLAGILLLITEPFRIGDQIVVGSYEGTVEEIQTRATLLKTYDGRRVVIPNADLFVDSVTVNTAFEKRRIEYDVGIGYGDDVEKARRLIAAALGGCSSVLDDPAPEVLVIEFAPSSVNLRVRWWIEPPRLRDAFDSQDEVLTAVKQSLTEHGIDLPFTTYQVLFHDQSEEADGDRQRQREGWPGGNHQAPRPRSIAGSLNRLAGTNRTACEERRS